MQHTVRKFQDITSTSSILLGTTMFLCFLLESILPASATDLQMIPDTVKVAKSPNCTHEIFDVNKGFAPDGEQNRELYIRKRDGKGKQRLLSYHRCVDVCWCPNSKAFVLNDNVGSNLVMTYLYRVDDLKHPVEITPLLMKAVLDKKDKLDIERSDVFLLINATRWINENALELSVRGAGQKAGCFRILYEWDLKNNFKKLKRINDI